MVEREICTIYLEGGGIQICTLYYNSLAHQVGEHSFKTVKNCSGLVQKLVKH